MESRITLREIIIGADGAGRVIVRVAGDKPLRQLSQLVHLTLILLYLVMENLFFYFFIIDQRSMSSSFQQIVLLVLARRFLLPFARGVECRSNRQCRRLAPISKGDSPFDRAIGLRPVSAFQTGANPSAILPADCVVTSPLRPSLPNVLLVCLLQSINQITRRLINKVKTAIFFSCVGS